MFGYVWLRADNNVRYKTRSIINRYAQRYKRKSIHLFIHRFIVRKKRCTSSINRGESEARHKTA